MTSLQEFAKAQLEVAKRIVRKGQELTPVLIFDAPDHVRRIVAVPTYDHDREHARHAMTTLLKMKDAERYCFVMEVWFGSPGNQNDPAYLPSKDPKRLECICVSAQDETGAKLLLVAEIKRGKRGLVQFKDWSPDHGIFLGPLGELLKEGTRQ